MFANLLIGLREGLEASLVVSILIAYLVKTDRRSELTYIWVGVGTAVALVLVVFTAVKVTFDQLPFRAQEITGGVLSILAAALVTWMIFWMRRTARNLKRELEGEMERAVSMGPVALVTIAFLTVGREGLETAAIMWSTVTGAYTPGPFVGATLGLTVSVVLGYLIYLGALKVNLSQFFTITGALLIVVSAGVLAYGVFDLQEAGVLPGASSLAFDITSVIPPSSWYGTFLKGTVNFQPNPSWLQVGVWLAFIIPVLALYLRPQRAAKVAAV